MSQRLLRRATANKSTRHAVRGNPGDGGLVISPRHKKQSILVDTDDFVVQQSFNVSMEVLRTAWTKANEENLVEVWQEYPCLFDVSSTSPNTV